jgi:hypothetical protein
LARGREEFLLRQNDFQRELETNLREIDDFLSFIVKCNEPTVLREGNFERLAEVATHEYIDIKGRRKPLLTIQEVKMLSISRGNLDEVERRQIEQHVGHTLTFLVANPVDSGDQKHTGNRFGAS